MSARFDSVYKRKFTTGRSSELPRSLIGAMDRLIKKEESETYGSLSAATWSGFNSRKPGDVDIAVNDVKKTAERISSEFRQRRIPHRVKYNPRYKSAQISIKQNGKWVTVVDIQDRNMHSSDFLENVQKRPIAPIKSSNGILVQHPEDQLNRKRNSVKSKENNAHRIEKDAYDLVSTAVLLDDSSMLKARADWARGNLNAPVERGEYGQLAMGATFDSIMAGVSPIEIPGAFKDPIPRHHENKYIKKASEKKAPFCPVTKTKRKHKNLDDLNIDEFGKVRWF